MPDSFGLVNSILSPLLERVAREERLGRDHPRKGKDGKPEKSRADVVDPGMASGEPEEASNSMSSTHIDLRI